MINREVSRAVRFALMMSAVAAGGATAPALAQDQDQERAETVTTVTVTGSRIQRQDFEATSPIVTVSADTFELSGEVQIETVLNTLPQLVPSITTTSNNPSNGGQANIDLRGLGTVRTLVLMDGTRLAPSNVSGVIDLNTIPSGLIEGVEILTGGASSTYGSDAIAGVVNVRMKRNFSGIELSAQHNVTEESDGKTLLVEALIGGNFADDRGNAVLALGYDKRDEVFAGARPFSQVALGGALQPLGSGATPEARINWGGAANRPSQAVYDAVFAQYGAAPGTATPATALGINADGTVFSFGNGTAAQPVVNYRGDTSDPGFNPLSFSYNYSPVNYLQLPLERRQIAGFVRYDIVPDVVETYARLMFTTYHSDQELAATPVTCSGAQLGCTVPVTNSAIPSALRTLLEARPDPTQPLNMWKRTVEVGSRFQENGYDVVQGLFGFRGRFGGDYQWDIYGSWGQAEGVSIQEGNVSRARLQAALNDPTVYASQGCALFNPFQLGALSPACAQAIAISATNVLDTEQLNFVGSITGSLFDGWAGAIKFAAGAEYRENKAEFRPDTFLASGDVVGFNASQPVAGSINVVEPFAELSVPLLADKPFVDYLGLELGYRYSDYNLAGSADTYKVALGYNPVPAFKVRGSYARAIRAPSILELFQPQQENFPAYTDPCNFNSTFRSGPNAAQIEALCQAQGIAAADLPTYQQINSQARSFIGGNLNLTPEVADTYTVGFTFQSTATSDWFARFNASVDWYKYEIEDVISSLDVSSIVGRCFNQLNANPTFDPNNVFCRLFTRNPSTLGVTDIVATNLNLAGRKLEGVDLNLDWALPLTAMGAPDGAGDLSFKLVWTHLLAVEEQETAVDPFFGREGTISTQVGSAYPKNKAVLHTTFARGPLQLRYSARYIAGMDAVVADAVFTPSTTTKPYTPSYVYHDLVGRWRVTDNLGVTLGITNLGDKDPPIYTVLANRAGVQANTDPSTYDVLGRRYFLNVTVNF